MNDSLSTRGLVATVPNHIVTSEGLPITSFRLAASQRKYNRSTQSWENGETNWFTVTAFRQLATNIAACVAKGDRIVVSGRLSVRDWQSGERSGTVVEIDADAVGHDLTWGTANFSRTLKRSELAEGRPVDGADSEGTVSSDAAAASSAESPHGAGAGESEDLLTSRTQSAWDEADLPTPTGGLLTGPATDEDADTDTEGPTVASGSAL
jgi:single-strand DNA-binding protein